MCVRTAANRIVSHARKLGAKGVLERNRPYSTVYISSGWGVQMNTPEQFTCSVQFSSVHVQFTYFSPTATKRFWTLWTSKFAFSTDLTRAALLRCNPRRAGHPAHRRLLRSDQSWQPTFLASSLRPARRADRSDEDMHRSSVPYPCRHIWRPGRRGSDSLYLQRGGDEVPAPTPGSKVEKDPVHLWAGTPRRTEPTTGTPSDRAFKKSGNAASNPYVVPEWLPEEEAEEGEEDQE